MDSDLFMISVKIVVTIRLDTVATLKQKVG